MVEHLDGHTDILHIKLYNHWLPWSVFKFKRKVSQNVFVCLTPLFVGERNEEICCCDVTGEEKMMEPMVSISEINYL